MWRFPAKTGLVVAAGALSVALLAACTGSGSNGAALSGLTSAQLEALGRAGSAFGGGYVQGTGIHANGVGKATAEPDVAVIRLGVEGFASTVAEARDIAATAMDAMLTALREQGVAEDDLQTQYFNIQPEYTYEEIVVPRGSEISPDGTVRRSERRLIGYRVTNTLTAKVRDLDKVGETIDAVVDAGGDATRIDSIQFTVEDGTALEAKARELAIQDAVAKADVFAGQAGVERGQLQFIAETSSPQYPKSFDMVAEARAVGGVPPTQINPWQFEVTVAVQAIFGID